MDSGFHLASNDFQAGAVIPRQHTCQGADQSPEMHWSDVPAGTATLALIVDDPDAPAGVWVHWLAWNVLATEHGITADFARQEQSANGTRQGRNDFGKIGYNGPCPPPGKTHRYFFRLYALDTKLNLQPGATRAELDAAMQGHVVAKTEYMGTYKTVAVRTKAPSL